jgi:hypothetical protein
MTPSNSVSSYLKRYPGARPETLAWLMKRDEKLHQLRKEMAPKPRAGFVLPRVIYAVADAFRWWKSES